MADLTTPTLAGVRVLDLTTFLSGPYGTQMLADLGAEVIKLEAPSGDLARVIEPHFVAEDSVYYLSINRSKQGVALDLKQAEGRDLARRLMLASDIVVDNFRPGVLARIGIDVAALRRERPELIWCSISGYGQTGPYAEKPAYDMIVQAMSGGMSLTGEPGRAAVRAGIPIGDICAGMYAATAILAALHRRHATGRGDVIDISMLDCQAAMLSYQAAYHLHAGTVPGRQGSGHDSFPTYRGFPTAAGELVITANTERMWEGLCRALSLDPLRDDPRFRTNRDRYDNREILWTLLEEAFGRRTATEWVPLLEAQGVPVGVVNTLDRVVADPQIVHRNMVIELSDADGRRARVMGSPFHFEEAAAAVTTYPPKLGEHTARVLGDVLGLPPDELARLAANGTIVAAPTTGETRGRAA